MTPCMSWRHRLNNLISWSFAVFYSLIDKKNVSVTFENVSNADILIHWLLSSLITRGDAHVSDLASLLVVYDSLLTDLFLIFKLKRSKLKKMCAKERHSCQLIRLVILNRGPCLHFWTKSKGDQKIEIDESRICIEKEQLVCWWAKDEWKDSEFESISDVTSDKLEWIPSIFCFFSDSLIRHLFCL